MINIRQASSLPRSNNKHRSLLLGWCSDRAYTKNKIHKSINTIKDNRNKKIEFIWCQKCLNALIYYFIRLMFIGPKKITRHFFGLFFFGRHSCIEPTNDYHEHTHTRMHTSPTVSGNPLIRRCPGPTSLTGLGGGPPNDWTTQRLGTYSSCPQLTPFGIEPG